MSGNNSRSCWQAAALTALTAGILLFPLLGFPVISGVSEAREGSVVTEISRTGSYILPLRHGQIVPSKPVLFHWIGALFVRLSGEYGEFGLRAPSAAGASLLAAATAASAGSIGGFAYGLIAGGILLSSYGFVHLAGDGRVDMLFALLTSLPMLVWLPCACAARRERRGFETIPFWVYHVCGASAGLAMLTKGPLGLGMPLLVIGSMSVWLGGRRSFRFMLHPGWVWALVISLPWYLLASWRGGQSFIGRQLIFENLVRFTGGNGIPSKPAYLYLQHFWDEAAPWSVVFGIYLLVLLRAGIKRGSEGIARLLPIDEGERTAISGSLVWFFVVFVLLSLSAGKRPAYLLPLFPALALTTALGPAQLLRRAFHDGPQPFFGKRLVRSAAAILWSITLAALIVFLSSPWWTAGLRLSAPASITLQSLPEVVRDAPPSLYFFIVILPLLSLYCWHRGVNRRSPDLLGASLFLYVAFLLVPCGQTGQALKSATHTFRGLAEEVKSALPPDTILHVVKDAQDESLDTFLFYYAGRVQLHEPESWMPEDDSWYITRGAWLEALPAHPVLKNFILHLRGNRRIDPPEEDFYLVTYPKNK